MDALPTKQNRGVENTGRIIEKPPRNLDSSSRFISVWPSSVFSTLNPLVELIARVDYVEITFVWLKCRFSKRRLMSSEFILFVFVVFNEFISFSLMFKGKFYTEYFNSFCYLCL